MLDKIDGASSEFMHAKVWIPAKKVDQIREVLQGASQGGHAGETGSLPLRIWPTDPNMDLEGQIHEAHALRLRIPTYFATNAWTSGFQGIVDAYGVATYQEANPAMLAIPIFPFLFGVMFGDILHGTIMLIFALICIKFESQINASSLVQNEIFSYPYGGRYMIVVMSVCAIYMGFIYNEVASVPIDIFRSAYPANATTLLSASNFTMPYTLGVDPIWRWSSNNVGFTNSLKMKMAIILGVCHMTVGVLMKASNTFHFKDRLTFYCESIPELVLFMAIFGYLCILIFIKWSTNWNIVDLEDHVVYPRGPPALITTLIGLAFGGHVVHRDVLISPESCLPRS